MSLEVIFDVVVFVSLYVRFCAERAGAAVSTFAYPTFVHSASNAATNASKSASTMLPNRGCDVDHLPAVNRGDVIPNAIRASSRGSSRSGHASRISWIRAASGTPCAMGENSTPAPLVQKLNWPHMPPGMASSSPKYAARPCAKPGDGYQSVQATQYETSLNIYSCHRWRTRSPVASSQQLRFRV